MASIETAWVYARSSADMLWLLAWCLWGTVTVEAGVTLILWLDLEIFPIRLPCPLWRLSPCLFLSCFVLFGCPLLEVCCSLKRKWGCGVDLGERRIGEVGGSWEDWREGKQWSGYTVWEKNLSSIKTSIQYCLKENAKKGSNNEQRKVK